jgi:hypothetical protein
LDNLTQWEHRVLNASGYNLEAKREVAKLPPGKRLQVVRVLAANTDTKGQNGEIPNKTPLGFGSKHKHRR